MEVQTSAACARAGRGTGTGRGVRSGAPPGPRGPDAGAWPGRPCGGSGRLQGLRQAHCGRAVRTARRRGAPRGRRRAHRADRRSRRARGGARRSAGSITANRRRRTQAGGWTDGRQGWRGGWCEVRKSRVRGLCVRGGGGLTLPSPFGARVRLDAPVRTHGQDTGAPARGAAVPRS